jgi:hypothetical protein
MSEFPCTRVAVPLLIGTCVRFDPVVVAKWLRVQ